MKQLILPFILLILLGIGVIFLKFVYKWENLSQAVINGHNIKLLMADTPSKRNRGLSFRDSLPRDSGMLFIFEKKDIYSFWMNEMKFPLDFLWINDETIVDLSENIPLFSEGEITTVKPSKPVNKVLEVNSGIIKEYGLKKGDKITFK